MRLSGRALVLVVLVATGCGPVVGALAIGGAVSGALSSTRSGGKDRSPEPVTLEPAPQGYLGPPPPPPPSYVAWKSVGFFDTFRPQISQVAVAPGGVVLVLTDKGLYRTANGSSWSLVPGTSPPTGRWPATCFAVANTTVYFASTPDAYGSVGAVYVSADSGASFVSVTTMAPPLTRMIACSAVPQTIFATDIGRLYRSTDGGVTWTQALVGPSATTYDVAQTDSGTVIAGLDSVAGILVTHDGGASWASALWGTVVGPVGIDPVNSSTMYASFQGGVKKSIDGGATWNDASGGWPAGFGPTRIVIARSNPATIYANVEGAFSSQDAGATWGPANAGIAQYSAPLLAVDPSDPLVVYAATEGLLLKTTTGGR